MSYAVGDEGIGIVKGLRRHLTSALPFTGLALAAASLAFPLAAHASERANATASSRAVIVARLSFIKTDDLDFGQIVAGSRSGTVTITPSGDRTATGGVLLAGSNGHPARFSGYGFPNQNVNISVSSNNGTLRRAGGTETMRFDTFVIGSTPQAQITTSPLAFRIASQTGMFAFPVGATLRVNARQAPGTYSGTFTVVLQYQ